MEYLNTSLQATCGVWSSKFEEQCACHSDNMQLLTTGKDCLYVWLPAHYRHYICTRLVSVFFFFFFMTLTVYETWITSDRPKTAPKLKHLILLWSKTYHLPISGCFLWCGWYFFWSTPCNDLIHKSRSTVQYVNRSLLLLQSIHLHQEDFWLIIEAVNT